MRHLPAHGWNVDVLAAPERPSAQEFSERPDVQRRGTSRARVMARVGEIADPAFRVAGLRPEAVPLSMLWLPRGAAELRRRLASGRYDCVLATAPPTVAALVARAGRRAGGPPLVLELRDLWAGNPLFDRGGPILPALERSVVARASAVVVTTPEAAADVRGRHPGREVSVITNGFADELLDLRREPEGKPPLTIVHSGSLTVDRPLAPLLDVLARERFRDAFRLVVHGFVAPSIRAEIERARAVDIEVRPPSTWREAVETIAREADVGLVSQGTSAGDATAVAAKVYEYMALGKPVLCVSGGGATEAVLDRLGAAQAAARFGDEESIAGALDRLLAGEAGPVLPERLQPYRRSELAREMAALLDDVA